MAIVNDVMEGEMLSQQLCEGKPLFYIGYFPDEMQTGKVFISYRILDYKELMQLVEKITWTPVYAETDSMNLYRLCRTKLMLNSEDSAWVLGSYHNSKEAAIESETRSTIGTRLVFV